jgi:hypothetical protein
LLFVRERLFFHRTGLSVNWTGKQVYGFDSSTLTHGTPAMTAVSQCLPPSLVLGFMLGSMN